MSDQATTMRAVPAGSDRRILWLSLALGFAAGLPFSLLVGSVGVWLTNAGVGFGTIGALSWIGLFYAFKFLWAPLFDWLLPPGLTTIGRRRGWMALCQIVIAGCLFAMSFTDPRESILLFAVFAVVAAFASASQDIVIDAWRIETANEQATIDQISLRYQFGYRVAAIMAGAVALLLADLWATVADAAAGWPPIFLIMAVLMALCVLASFAAPEPLLRPKAPALETAAQDAAADAETGRIRRAAVVPVAIGWALSGAALVGFMFYTLWDQEISAAEFRDAAVPWILLATIGLPLALSFWLVRKPGVMDAPVSAKRMSDVLFQRVLAPLADVVRRYWLWAIPVLLLAMTYRIADSIWGSFANPFYISILEHSNSDVAVPSTMVGVVATLGGIALGGLAIALVGRMPALIVGAVLASVTNLLYADLALGASWITEFLRVTGIGPVFSFFLEGFVGAVQGTGATIFDGVTVNDRLTQLTAVITMENLAGGFASAVHIAWLSSIVNRDFAAVQYALLASMAMLIGVIFRPRIGAYVDQVKDQGLEAQADRFADVFIFAAWIGVAAIVLAGVEWYRQSREKAQAQAAAPAPSAAE
jgi:PAT family beta-lactamase induction signal transducer AmpG